MLSSEIQEELEGYSPYFSSRDGVIPFASYPTIEIIVSNERYYVHSNGQSIELENMNLLEDYKEWLRLQSIK